MTVRRAFDALADRAAALLTEAGFLPSSDVLGRELVDVALAGPAGDLQTAATLISAQARTVQRMTGRPPVYVVERDVVLTLSADAPDPERRDAALEAAVAAVARLWEADETLGGACERLLPVASTPEDFGATGLSERIELTVRVRAGDPFGRTPAAY